MVTNTELPLAITFFTPHKTIDGEQILLTVGVGKDVSVNCLLGLPFLKGAKATIDLEAGSVRAPVFRDVRGWPLLYRRPDLTACLQRLAC